MTPAQARRAKATSHAAVGLLFSLFAAGCTSTTEPSLDLAAPSFTGSSEMQSVSDSEALQADNAEASAMTTEGDVVLPEQVAYLPARTPAAEAAAASELPTSTQAAPAEMAVEQEPEAAPATPVMENGGPILTAGIMPAPSLPPKKKTFLSGLFGTSQADAAPAPQMATAEKPKPLVTLASASSDDKPLRMAALDPGDDSGFDALPGVRKSALFEIKRKSGIDDDSDVDLHEDEMPTIQLASAAGLARLAPNGLLKQRETVDVACLRPDLLRVLKTVEQHYGRKMLVTSGFRSPAYNRQVRGAEKSLHMQCAAADVQVPGVSKWELAKYVRAMPERGGVGTYCHTESVHIDVGPERDWNWRCRRRR